MPTVGRLEVRVKPMPASRSRRTAFLAPSVKVLSLVSSVPSTSETTQGDAGHGRFLLFAALSAGLSPNWRMMSSTMVSTGASIDTVTGFSLLAGGSSVLNWLASSPGGMKWPLRAASRLAISSCVPSRKTILTSSRPCTRMSR